MDYKINASRISMREFFWETKLFGWVGLLVKIFKIRVNGSSDDLAVDSLTPYETTQESIPAEAQQKFAPILKKLLAAGFESPILWHLEYNAVQSTQNVIATLRHKSGRSWVRLQRRTNFARTPSKTKQFITFVSSTLDDGFIVTGNGKYDLAWPITHDVVRYRKLLSDQVWEKHQQRLPQNVKVLRADELRDQAEWYHETLRNFHVSRGVFVPLTEEENALYAEPAVEQTAGQTMSPTPTPAMPADGATPYPAAGALPPGDPMESAVLTELRVLQNKKVNWTTSIVLLLVSGLAFAANARGGDAKDDKIFLAILIGVLLVHETGHYLAMKLFGYKNLRMFFLPGFGAAVSGRHYNAPAWKKIVVSLMGPLPGILFGTICCIAGLPQLTGSEVLYKAGLFALIINAFNLIPILPLDGGWVAHAAIFSRSPMLDVGFRLVAALVLIGLGFVLPGFRFFPYIGVAALIGLPAASRNAKIVNALRRAHGPAASPDSQTIPPETGRVILAKLRERTKRTLHARNAAQQVMQIFETLNASPPSVGATLGLLSLHATGFLLALVIGVAAVALHSPGFAEGFRRGLHPNVAFTLPPLHYALAHDSIVARGVPIDGPHRTLVVRYKSDPLAANAFAQLPATMSAENLGQTLLISFATDADAAEKQFAAEQESNTQDMMLESDKYGAATSVNCDAPSEAAAARLRDQLNQSLSISHFGPVTPAWTAEDVWPQARRIEQLQLRAIYSEIRNKDYAAYFKSDASQKFQAAQRRGDPDQIEAAQKDLDAYDAKLSAEQAANVQAKYGHADFIRLVQSIMNEKKPQQQRARRSAELLPLMGTLQPADFDRVGSTGGYVSAEKSTVQIRGLRFSHTDTGLPALWRWLQAQGCHHARYEFSGLAKRGVLDQEDDEFND